MFVCCRLLNTIGVIERYELLQWIYFLFTRVFWSRLNSVLNICIVCLKNIMRYFTVLGWSHPADFGSPDEQSGAVCLSLGSGRQCKHTGQRGKVQD